MSRPRRFAWPLVGLVVIAGALSLSAFPLRTLADQRRAISDSKAELVEIEGQIDGLEARLAALDTPSEIERLARERYSMVRPGEEPYGILPSVPTDVPPDG
jgi:cell division protein FtsB